MERIAAPEEVAKMVRFLLSEDSSFTTGQTLLTCGGRIMLP
jgi:3-oxoacyl-[acyl-carrier protein] reductase